MQFPSELLEEIRLHLEKEKNDTEKRIAALTTQDPYSDPERTNDNAAIDHDASEEADHDRVIAQIDELKLQLTDINDALMRIGNGKYGFCKNCGKMIDTDRLNIIPETTLCLECEKKRQNKIPKT
jgi:RNA polymerase-binding transcription factor DksA